LSAVNRTAPASPVYKRINIVLPEATIQTIDRVAKPGQWSRFINEGCGTLSRTGAQNLSGLN
jgi:hypothetical protein